MAKVVIEYDPKLFEPHSEEQREFLENLVDRYIAAAGGFRAGKTWVGARKLITLHALNGVDEAGECTGVDSLAVAQTYQAAQTVVIPEIRKALAECGLPYRFVADSTKFWFELPTLRSGNDPSLIYIRTAEKPQTIAGFEVGAVWGDEVARWNCDEEDPQRNPILQSAARLADYRAAFQQFLMTYTNEGDATLVYKNFEGEPKKGHRLYRLSTVKNPLMSGFVQEQRGYLSEELAKQYIEGFAVNLRGSVVYDNFSDQPGRSNIDESITFDLDRPLQISMDFNVNPGSHVILGQHFPEKRLMTAIWELFEDRMDAKFFVSVVFPKFMREVLDKLPQKRPGGWRFPGRLEWFGDPSGNADGLQEGHSCWEVIAAGLKVIGVPFTMVNVPSGPVHVADRVNAANAAFYNMNHEVRYKVHPRCKRLIADYKTLKWNGNKIDKKDQLKSHASEADTHRIFQLMPIIKIKVPAGQVSTT